MQGRRTVALAALALVFTTGCSLKQEYPPAYPAPRWDPTKPFLFTRATAPRDVCPPPARLVANPHGLPSADDWKGQWKLKAISQRVCKGKGKQRVCRTEPATAVDEANRQAVLRATPFNTKQGTSGQVRFPFDPREAHIYEIVTSPHEFTYLALLEGERQATQLLLNPEHWEVLYGKSGEEGSRQEVLTVRPIVQPDQKLPPRTRAVVVYQSGIKQWLLFRAQERPGMISVEWFMDEEKKKPVPPPVDQQPPVFDGERAYAGYSITMESKKKLQPPWLPEAVLDDGKHTLIKFATDFEGIRLPILSGVQQNGQPALVQSRLYVRPGTGAAWLWVQGLWPALRLKDAAGITVKVVRHVPKPQEQLYENLKVSQVGTPAQNGGLPRVDERRFGAGADHVSSVSANHPGRADEPDRPDDDGRADSGGPGQWQRDRRPDDHHVFTVQLGLGTSGVDPDAHAGAGRSGR